MKGSKRLIASLPTSIGDPCYRPTNINVLYSIVFSSDNKLNAFFVL